MVTPKIRLDIRGLDMKPKVETLVLNRVGHLLEEAKLTGSYGGAAILGSCKPQGREKERIDVRPSGRDCVKVVFRYETTQVTISLRGPLAAEKLSQVLNGVLNPPSTPVAQVPPAPQQEVQKTLEVPCTTEAPLPEALEVPETPAPPVTKPRLEPMVFKPPVSAYGRLREVLDDPLLLELALGELWSLATFMGKLPEDGRLLAWAHQAFNVKDGRTLRPFWTELIEKGYLERRGRQLWLVRGKK